MYQIHINALPIEILHLIFDTLEINRSSLLSASLVCYTWKLLSQPRLLRVIHIDENFYSSSPVRILLGPTNMLMSFADALRMSESHWIDETKEGQRQRHSTSRQRPRPLSDFIRSLTVHKPEYDYGNYLFYTAKILAVPTLDILSMTHNLTHLQIDDFYTLDFVKLKIALIHNHFLVKLVLTSESGPDRRRKVHSDQGVFRSLAGIVTKPLFARAWELASFAINLPYMETFSYDDVTGNDYAPKQAELSRLPSDIRLDRIHVVNSLCRPTIGLRTLSLTAAAPLVTADIIALTALSFPSLTSFQATLYLPGAVDDDLHALISLVTSFPSTLAQLHLFDLPILKDSIKGKDISIWIALRSPYSDSAQAAFASALYGALPNLTSVTLSARFLSPMQLTTISSKSDIYFVNLTISGAKDALTEVFYYDVSQSQVDELAVALSNSRNLPYLQRLRLCAARIDNYRLWTESQAMSRVCKDRDISFGVKSWGGKFYNEYLNHAAEKELYRFFEWVE